MIPFSRILYDSYQPVNLFILRTIYKSGTFMANTKFEYVRSFENDDKMKPFQWIVIHLKFIERMKVFPPKDYTRDQHRKFQNVMLSAGNYVMNKMKELTLGYGFGDTFSFVFPKNCSLYKRRGFKLLTTVSSLFSSAFVSSWNEKFDRSTLQPLFEGSIYLLSQDQFLRDYLTYEQYKCHLDNLHLTTLRNLIEVAEYSYDDALERVNCSSESQKNEMLFSLCNINYNNVDSKAKKGSILLCKSIHSNNESVHIETIKQNRLLKYESRSIEEMQKDFCKDAFWTDEFKLDEITKHGSKYDYLSSCKMKHFILPHTWIVVRIDGKSFHKFSEVHNFTKPNERRSLRIMTESAKVVMTTFSKIILSYGQSDEYSFILKRYNHREKDCYSLSSRIVSLFAGSFVQLWPQEFKHEPLQYSPAFDARVILYPTNSALRDYLSWRQADCHINNMYNTCFWKLIEHKGLSNTDAEKYLRGTFSKDKLEILENELSLQYSLEESVFRKGTILYNSCIDHLGKQDEGEKEAIILEECIDLIQDDFWVQRPWLLGEEL